jgi:hypothetical protein
MTTTNFRRTSAALFLKSFELNLTTIPRGKDWQIINLRLINWILQWDSIMHVYYIIYAGPLLRMCNWGSVFSNVKHKLQIYTILIYSHIQYNICNIHALTYQLSDSRLLSEYFTVGLITRRYIFQHISWASNFSKVKGKLEFGNFKALLITVRVALLRHARFAPFVVCDISEIKRSLYFVTIPHLSIK